MPRAKQASKQASLAQVLAEQFGGRLDAGREFGGELTYRSVLNEDLVVEVQVRVRRRVTSTAADQYRAQALEALRKDPFRVRHCECRVNQGKSIWSSRGGERDCGGRVVAVVAYEGLTFYRTNLPSFRFVCGRHREAHGIASCDVLGIVELTRSELAPTHQLAEERSQAFRAELRAEEAERVRLAEERRQAERAAAEQAAEAEGRLRRLPGVPRPADCSEPTAEDEGALVPLPTGGRRG